MSAVDILIVIAIVILALWLLGLIFAFMPGPIIWLLLVVGLIFLIIWLVRKLKLRK
jgi:hypothetical protein